MRVVTGPNNHVFGRTRPSAKGTSAIHQEPPRDTKFRDLPPPTGEAPFRLDLKDILPAEDYQRIVDTGRLVFHLNGDMGGVKEAMPQLLVAKGMEQDLGKP